MAGAKVVNRLVFAGVAALAAALIAAPTVVGLRGNSSFTRDIPVPVPSGAHPAVFTEPSPSGGRSTLEDHPGHDAASVEATDDHGGLRHDTAAGTGSSDDRAIGHDVGDHRGGRHGSDDPSGGRHGSDDPSGDRHGGRGDG